MTPLGENGNIKRGSAAPTPRRAHIRIWQSIAYGLLAAAIWGGSAVVSRHLVTAGGSPLDLAFWRYAGAFPTACVLLLISGRYGWTTWPWHRILLLMVLASPPYHLLVIAGYGHASAGVGSLIVSGLLPVFTIMLLAFTATHRDHVTTQIYAAACTLAGVALLGLAAMPDSAAHIPHLFTPLGIFMFTLAAGAWALLNHLVQRWHLNPVDLTLFLGFSAPVFLPAYWMASGSYFPQLPLHDGVLQLTYHGMLVGIAATYLFFASIVGSGPSMASSLQALAPAFAVIFGITILSEPFSGKIALSTAFIVFGILLAARAANPPG